MKFFCSGVGVGNGRFIDGNKGEGASIRRAIEKQKEELSLQTGSARPGGAAALQLRKRLQALLQSKQWTGSSARVACCRQH
jgi:hypothetical protein